MIRKKFKIYLTQEASEDLSALLEYYKKLMFHLAKNLILELDKTFKFLQNNPHSNETYDGQYGILNLRKYPVLVYYTIDRQDIIILSIRHKNSDFLQWINRV